MYKKPFLIDFLFFFFSSRRRHTRSYGDWSSDVCSSDLRERGDVVQRAGVHRARVIDAVVADRREQGEPAVPSHGEHGTRECAAVHFGPDRKSTRLNSSHRTISYAVFCLKKKK